MKQYLGNVKGKDGVSVTDISSRTSLNHCYLTFRLSDSNEKEVGFDLPQLDSSKFMRNDSSQVLNGNLTVKGTLYATDNITAFSDRRLKENIKIIPNALKKLEKINGYTFTMNGKQMTGVIAQEIEEVLPEVVEESENGYKTVAYGNIVGLLIQAIKELKKEVEVLKHDTK